LSRFTSIDDSSESAKGLVRALHLQRRAVDDGAKEGWTKVSTSAGKFETNGTPMLIPVTAVLLRGDAVVEVHAAADQLGCC